MAYYQDKIKALKLIEEIVLNNDTTSIENLNYVILMKFGFGKKIVAEHLETLEKQDKINIEKNIIKNKTI